MPANIILCVCFIAQILFVYDRFICTEENQKS